MFLGQLTHKGIRTETASATFLIAAGVTEEHIGKPMAITGNYEVGFGADGDAIVGFLESYEDRITEGAKTGAVNWHMCAEFEYSGTAPVAKDYAVCDGTGKVRKATAGEAQNCLIVSVDTTAQTVAVILR